MTGRLITYYEEYVYRRWGPWLRNSGRHDSCYNVMSHLGPLNKKTRQYGMKETWMAEACSADEIFKSFQMIWKKYFIINLNTVFVCTFYIFKDK
jgi:hypothetical protein